MEHETTAKGVKSTAVFPTRNKRKAHRERRSIQTAFLDALKGKSKSKTAKEKKRKLEKGHWFGQKKPRGRGVKKKVIVITRGSVSKPGGYWSREKRLEFEWGGGFPGEKSFIQADNKRTSKRERGVSGRFSHGEATQGFKEKSRLSVTEDFTLEDSHQKSTWEAQSHSHHL